MASDHHTLYFVDDTFRWGTIKKFLDRSWCMHTEHVRVIYIAPATTVTGQPAA